MTFTLENGWLTPAKHIVSPNCDDRPQNALVDLLVIHNISLPPGQYGGPWIEALFTNSLDPGAHPYFAEIHQMQVSSHLLIQRNGKILQFVPLHKRAWHAGQSCFQEREQCNDYSIGIELEGCDDETYSDEQYQCLIELTRFIMTLYPGITKTRIAGHADISPGRKTDPGPLFDWSRYLDQLLTHST